MNLHGLSIGRRLIASMMLTTVVALILAGGALIVYDAFSDRQTLVRTLRTRAAIIASNATAALAFENRADADQLLAGLGRDPAVVMAALYDRNGRMFAYHPATLSVALLPAGPGAPGPRTERGAVVVVEPVTEDGAPLGSLYIKSDLSALARQQRVSVLVVLLALLGACAVAFAVANWLQRAISTPVRRLADAAERVTGERDYAVRVEVTGDDEIGLLTRAFNGMLAEIRKRDAELRASQARLQELNSDLERRVRDRTSELETSNRELEAFSYSVSHDLRAPLRHIDGFADLLRRHAAERLDDKGRRYLDTVSQSAKRMGVLIDDLLSFSRMGRTELCHEAVDLGRIVTDVRGLLASDLEGREIVWDIEPLPEVTGDTAMLRVAVTNLLSNAVKYTRGRTPARIRIGAKAEDGETVIFVEDNGAGFDMTYQHKLFGVFQRLHSSDDFEGTGIGLANVRRIVQRHGGRVWAESTPGEGATFYAALPHGAATPRELEAA